MTLLIVIDMQNDFGFISARMETTCPLTVSR